MANRIQVHSMVALAGLVPFVSFLWPRSLGTVVPIIAICAVAGHIAERQRVLLPGREKWVFFLAALFVAVFTSYWAPEPMGTLERVAKLVLFVPLGLALVSVAVTLDQNERRLVRSAFLVGVCIGMLLLLFHTFGNGGVFALLHGGAMPQEVLDAANRPSVILLGLFAALVISTQSSGKPSLPWMMGGVFLGLFATTESQSALLGMMVWLAVFAVARLKLNFAVSATKVFGGSIILLLPTILGCFYMWSGGEVFNVEYGSVSARLEIWYATALKVVDAPLLGHGLEASRSIDWSGFTFQFYGGPGIPHAHNAILQVWLEFGLLGALGATIAWVWLVRQVELVDAQKQAPLLAALGSLFFVLSVSHGMWQSWWINGIFGMVAITVIVAGPSRAEQKAVSANK